MRVQFIGMARFTRTVVGPIVIEDGYLMNGNGVPVWPVHPDTHLTITPGAATTDELVRPRDYKERAAGE